VAETNYRKQKVSIDPPARSVFVKTYGCQMNVYDSERMTGLLKPLGYSVCETPDTADLVILNTCHIREKAAEKVYSELGRLKQVKKKQEHSGKSSIWPSVIPQAT